MIKGSERSPARGSQMDPSPPPIGRRSSIDSAHTDGTTPDADWENSSTVSGTSTVEGDFVGKLFSRVRHNRGKEAEYLIDSGCTSVDCRDNTGCTPLMIASQNGHKRMVKMLLKRYANPNTQNNSGQTPLHFCLRFGHRELGEYLISKGADPSIADSQGITWSNDVDNPTSQSQAPPISVKPPASTPADTNLAAQHAALLAQADQALAYAAACSAATGVTPTESHEPPEVPTESCEGTEAPCPVTTQPETAMATVSVATQPETAMQPTPEVNMNVWQPNSECPPRPSFPNPANLSVNTEKEVSFIEEQRPQTPNSMSPGTGGSPIDSAVSNSPLESPIDSPSPDSFSSLGNNPACSRSRGASFMQTLDEMVLRAKESQGGSRRTRVGSPAGHAQQVDPYRTMAARSQQHPAAHRPAAKPPANPPAQQFAQQPQYHQQQPQYHPQQAQPMMYQPQPHQAHDQHSPYQQPHLQQAQQPQPHHQPHDQHQPYQQQHHLQQPQQPQPQHQPHDQHQPHQQQQHHLQQPQQQYYSGVANGSYAGFGAMMPPPQPSVAAATQQQHTLMTGGRASPLSPMSGVHPDQLHNPPSPVHRTKRKEKSRAKTQRAPLPSTVPASNVQSMSVVIDNPSPQPSLEQNQMPTWDQLKQQEQPSQGPNSGVVDVEGLSDAMAGMNRGNGSAPPASKFENEWTMPREMEAASHPGMSAAMYNVEHTVQSPHQQSQAVQQQGEQGWGGAAGKFLGNFF